jgi:hypothetical protein
MCPMSRNVCRNGNTTFAIRFLRWRRLGRNKCLSQLKRTRIVDELLSSFASLIRNNHCHHHTTNTQHHRLHHHHTITPPPLPPSNTTQSVLSLGALTPFPESFHCSVYTDGASAVKNLSDSCQSVRSVIHSGDKARGANANEVLSCYLHLYIHDICTEPTGYSNAIKSPEGMDQTNHRRSQSLAHNSW